MVRAAAADNLQAATTARGWIEFDVGRSLQFSFSPAGGSAAFCTVAFVAALTTEQRVAAAASTQDVITRTCIDHVCLLVADEDVGESGALDALETEKPVMAVATGSVLSE